jgi:maleate cis-trans isomerase
MGLPFARGAAYGWRARIGMVFPSTVADTNVHEFYLMAPEGVELIITGLGLAGLNQEQYDRALGNVEDRVRLIVARRADVVLQAGVPPIVTHGWGFEDTVLAQVARYTSVPFITDVGASIRAMRAVGLARIVMVGNAFSAEIVDHVRRYLAGAGIDLVAARQVADDVREGASSLPLEAVYRAARAIFAEHATRADGIWLTQASTPSVGVIEDLETDLRVPVVTSAQALMWAGLRTVGVHEPIAGFGRLFRLESAPPRA